MFEAWTGDWKIVTEGQVGLLYRDGRFDHTLAPGRHRVTSREALVLVTTKRQSLVVSGQEVLSADAFLPKLGAVVEFTVTDPHLAHSRDEGSYLGAIQTSVQFALRQVAASRTAEDLARLPRDTLDAELLGLVTRDCDGLGVAIETVRLRDIVLPADIRRLLTGVEKARREGQAALERAHAEQAALRALANAARMLRNNPELQNLRLLQSIGATQAPVTIVLGTQAGIAPLRTDVSEA